MKYNLVRRILLLVIALFIGTSALLGILVSIQMKHAFLEEQKRSIAEIVQHRVKLHLNKEYFQSNNTNSNLPKFIEFKDEMLSSNIVRIKIYDSDGVVLYSDAPQLIGQKLFSDEPSVLQEILSGKVVADISNPNKTEDIYEKNFGQLLEIYVPIYFDNNNQVAGIIEVYYKVDILQHAIKQSQIILIAYICIIFAILFLFLYLIVRRASRKLLEQDRQLKKDIQKEKEYSSLKDEFITMSSHQLRTPASAIKWSLELLREGELSEDQKKLVDSSNLNNEKLIVIVNNLITASGIKSDYFTFEKKGYSLKKTVTELLKSKEQLIDKKKTTVNLNAPDNLAEINIKTSAITKITNILIDNAIIYTKTGGKIDIQITQSNDRQKFLIKDNGIGIPAKEQSKVFEKFFRASNAIEQSNVGSGLSLYIARTIVEGYEGKIGFESNKEGSMFIFEIPIK